MSTPKQLLYLSNSGYGGWVSFTYHLAKLLGNKRVLKAAPTAKGGGMFYGDVAYANVPEAAIHLLHQPIIVAVDKAHYHLLQRITSGTIVIHDPTELSEDVLAFARRNQVITIRNSVHKLLQQMGIDNTFLVHPFYRYARKQGSNSKNRALSRVDFDKNTHIICEANNRGAGVEIYGYKNHIYYFHKLRALGFDAYYKGYYKKDLPSVSRLYADTKYLVDLSTIKHDGGGTQYTFLEAEYHGAGLILHRDWCSVPQSIYKHGVNCYAVATPDELVDALRRPVLRSNVLPTDADNMRWYTTLIRNIKA